MKKNTEKDWQEKGDWKDGKVRSGAKTLIWVSLLFAVTFIGISLPAVLDVADKVARGDYIMLLILLFPLVGFSAFIIFVYSFLSWRKFGKTELILDPVPGSIGGDFGGSVDVPVKLTNNMEVNVTLNCMQTTTTGSGKNRSTNTKVIWQREGVAKLLAIKNGTQCVFRFSVPDDLPESEESSSNYNHWLLQMDCDLPGIDFNRGFSVPVFKKDKPEFSSLDVAYAKDSAPLNKAPERTVIVSENTNGLQFYYPWYRNLWMGIMLLIFGGIFSTVGYFVGESDGGFVFLLVFGGVGVAVVLFGLYVLGNSLTTTVSHQGINIIRNVYGIRFQRNVLKENIVQLERQINSQMQGGTRYRVFYSIVAHTSDNRKITIADSLEGSRVADYIEDRVQAALKDLQ
jgi:hypothetical protein